MLEAEYRRKIARRLTDTFPGCTVLKTDPREKQGILDLLVLFKNGLWAMLEVKTSPTAKKRPNQDFFVNQFAKMSFASFVYPENEEQVFSDLQSAFGGRRKTRLSKSK